MALFHTECGKEIFEFTVSHLQLNKQNGTKGKPVLWRFFSIQYFILMDDSYAVYQEIYVFLVMELMLPS